MSKWVQFYHKINKFDLVNMRFTDDFSIVEMTGMDSVMPIDGRLNLSSIRAEIQTHIESMKKTESSDPCAFSILPGPPLLSPSVIILILIWLIIEAGHGTCPADFGYLLPHAIL